MSSYARLFIVLVVVGGIFFTLGAIGGNATATPRIVEKVVYKNTVSANNALENEQIYRDIINLKNENLRIAGDVIGNWSYYGNSASRLNATTEIIKANNAKVDDLISQLKY